MSLGEGREGILTGWEKSGKTSRILFLVLYYVAKKNKSCLHHIYLKVLHNIQIICAYIKEFICEQRNACECVYIHMCIDLHVNL